MVDFRDRVNRILKSSTKTFGEPITYYPKKGGVYKIRGIFDHDYEAVDPDTEQLVSMNQPALGLNLNDVPFYPSVNDKVQVRNLKYRVIDSREDGQGGATLLLHRLDESSIIDKKYSQDLA